MNLYKTLQLFLALRARNPWPAFFAILLGPVLEPYCMNTLDVTLGRRSSHTKVRLVQEAVEKEDEQGEGSVRWTMLSMDGNVRTN